MSQPDTNNINKLIKHNASSPAIVFKKEEHPVIDESLNSSQSSANTHIVKKSKSEFQLKEKIDNLKDEETKLEIKRETIDDHNKNLLSVNKNCTYEDDCLSEKSVYFDALSEFSSESFSKLKLNGKNSSLLENKNDDDTKKSSSEKS